MTEQEALQRALQKNCAVCEQSSDVLYEDNLCAICWEDRYGFDLDELGRVPEERYL